ncbi:TetR/AcrR family transcriptional regulator [Heliophilum fasciatum]|uniref:TetR family transcriptional regulator n=1 Tax=Heliophilum fasciatum TaxID=35700 RepID=A0A4R2S7U6_9FIRM|nr:TetR/AcrR family transcriptional regulator [Heliophilum fasciatum]MCW2276993.1 AcrR family transcriptional regulator [Heliophilum fasciatum]TCP68481.1 TetR family transcriptional regulator [Heliophilum fasciatum]
MARITKKPEERKAELLEAAYRLFVKKGYHHTAVSDIVKEVGVAQGTFFYYFATKEDVLEAITERYIVRMLEDAKRITENPNLTAPQKLNDVLNSVLRNLGTQGETILQVLLEEKYLGLRQKLQSHSEQRFTPYLITILEQGQAEKSMYIEHLPETIDFINGIFSLLVESALSANSPEGLARKAAVAEKLIACAVGVPREQMRFYAVAPQHGQEAISNEK